MKGPKRRTKSRCSNRIYQLQCEVWGRIFRLIPGSQAALAMAAIVRHERKLPPTAMRCYLTIVLRQLSQHLAVSAFDHLSSEQCNQLQRCAAAALCTSPFLLEQRLDEEVHLASRVRSSRSVVCWTLLLSCSCTHDSSFTAGLLAVVLKRS